MRLGKGAVMTGQVYNDDTIAAISTPLGEGGIGIVRVSGRDALAIAKNVFRRREDKEVRSNKIHYGTIVDPESGGELDEVLLLYMKAPHSYTREDVVEIQCHGGVLILTKILEILLSRGARMADPGEFTRRAFMNGRIDMIQAEAVIDLIRSRSDDASRIAYSQLSGSASRLLRDFVRKITETIVLIEAPIDFPEEEIESLSDDALQSTLKSLIVELEALIERSKLGSVYRDGLKVTIAGKPNVGKSSLLNMLLGQRRAIVTEYPGTTRDLIEQWFNLKGVPVILQDTAGVRRSTDMIEKEGVERTLESLRESDFIIVVQDISLPLTDEDRDFNELVRSLGKPFMIAENKIDLLPPGERVPEDEGDEGVRISALTGEGRAKFEENLLRRVWNGDSLRGESGILSSVRQRNLLIKARESLTGALRTSEEGLPQDLCIVDMRKSLASFGELFGENFSEEILDSLFSTFCIGK
jgi:tRNA modification GTPase